jgi:hypothetical protein
MSLTLSHITNSKCEPRAAAKDGKSESGKEESSNFLETSHLLIDNAHILTRNHFEGGYMRRLLF